MKRIIISLAAFFVFSGAVFALESALIDFNELLDDYQGQHQATTVDFSVVSGQGFSAEEKELMTQSLLIPNWQVRLSSSSRSVTNDSLSYVKAATVGNNSVMFAGEQVMGVRVHFPMGPFNSYAWVEPPFDIPAYATSTIIEDAPQGDQFNGFGVLKNIGAIKRITANVYGLSHPIGFSVVLVDDNEQTTQIPMGYLDFEGWQELTWENPNYVTDVYNREVKRQPLYPHSSGSVTLESLQFYKDAMKEGGDFIGYVKDIRVTYDQAFIQDVDTDLEHEEVWGILAEREEVRREAELDRLGNMEILRFIEKQKMHQEEEADTAQ